MTPWQKPSTLLAFASWASVFALTWLLILGRVPPGYSILAAWLFFFAVAMIASAVASPRKKGSDDS